MKKIYTLLLICAAGTSYSQQGFGTSNPAPSAVIDMVASNKGALLPRIALTSTAVAAPVTSPANALTVFNTATTGDVTPGYYYWSTAGSKWIRMVDASATTTVSNTVANPTTAATLTTTVNGVTGTAVSLPNIYTSDGTLQGNRTVTQAANTLTFTGTATNAFSVDGNTFSVDAANNRIGVGTAAPSTALHINSASSGAFRLKDTTEGAGKYMVSDANGVGTWQTVQASKATALGTFPGSFATVVADGGSSPKYSQVYIDLTQGRWIVNAGNTITVSSANIRSWLHFYLSSATTSVSQAGFTHLGPSGNNTTYAGVLTYSNSGGNGNAGYNFVSGSSLINVTAATIRIYMLIENDTSGYWTYKTNNYENYFYAIPVN